MGIAKPLPRPAKPVWGRTGLPSTGPIVITGPVVVVGRTGKC